MGLDMYLTKRRRGSEDDRYFENVRTTIEQIERIIADAAEGDELFYHAWW